MSLSPRHESSSRNWWSLSPRLPTSFVKSDKILRRSFAPDKAPRDSQKQSGVKFNTFAAALGLKPKKHPSLTIQDSTIVKHVESPKADRQESSRYANRPPSKSVSSTLRSSLEPRTPSDGQRDAMTFRQSLMTLSDDPFASRGISVPGIQDPSRLSVYSSFTTPDEMPKNHELVAVVPNQDRSSYTSSGDGLLQTPVASPSETSYHSPLFKCVMHHNVYLFNY